MKGFMKRVCLLLVMILAMVGLSGCHIGQKDDHVCRVVTGISIVHHVGDATSTRDYSDPKKMELFLTYLRLLKPSILARTDPEEIAADSYRITLRFSDGSEKNYYQHGNRYLSENCQPWREVDPKYAGSLDELFRSTPGDP